MEARISRAAQVANHTSTADLLDDVLWRTGELASAGDRTSDMAPVALTISIATAPATLENSEFGALGVALDDSRSRVAPDSTRAPIFAP